MSRYTSDWGDEDYASQALWEANLQRAIKGKRGQVMLKRIEAALLAMPDRRLFAQGFLNPESGEACIWGAVAVHEGKVPGDGWLLDLNDGELGETASWVSGTWDCPFNLAWALADENDNGRHDETPEGRYARILRLVQRRINVEATT